VNGVISKTWSHDRNKLIFKQMQQGDGLRQISSLKNKIQKFPTTKKTTQHPGALQRRWQLLAYSTGRLADHTGVWRSE